MKTNIIDYILKNTDLKQKDIAEKLKVSRAQISKWKAGEQVPWERKEVLIKIAGLFGNNPEWAILSKSEENSKAWFEYFGYMNELNDEYYDSDLLADDPEIFVPGILILLSELGVKIPSKAPDINIMEDDGYSFSDFDNLLLDYIQCFGPINTWIVHFLNHDNEELFELESNFLHYSEDLTIKFVNEKLLIKNGANPHKIQQHNRKTEEVVKKDLIHICNIMRKKNIPFSINYFDLLNEEIHYIDNQIMFSGFSKNNVIDFLSYPEKIMFDRIEQMWEYLPKLYKKLEKIEQKLDIDE